MEGKESSGLQRRKNRSMAGKEVKIEYSSKGGDQEILRKFQINIYRMVAIPGDSNISKLKNNTISEDNLEEQTGKTLEISVQNVHC